MKSWNQFKPWEKVIIGILLWANIGLVVVYFCCV